MITATVSGSFHRFMTEIEHAVGSLSQMGVRVVSPADPRVVDAVGEFLFVASDSVRSIRMVQDRHLDSIAATDFLWLVCPDGYVGQSAAMEIGFAVAANVPIYSTSSPSDLTLRHYVRKVESMRTVVDYYLSGAQPARSTSFLIDPHASIETAHRVLDEIRQDLNRPPHAVDDLRAERIYEKRRSVSHAIADTAPHRRTR
jgi:hypothetical protein